VHAKDVRAAIRARARAKDLSSIKAVTEGVYTVPSEGLIDYREVFGQFAGCDEWIVIEAEQDPKKAPSFGYGAFGYPHVRRALSAVDLS
jgi:inosose dehydratase